MAPVETEVMTMRADLHLHTTASDGRWPPEQLIEEVLRAGIGLFSVTDHDSLDGLAETAARVATESGMPLLGSLPHDEEVEEALGRPQALAETPFGRVVDDVLASRLLAAD